MKTDIERVEKLGEEIGYGHMMSLASSLWRKKLKNEGHPIGGAFVPTILDCLGSTNKRMAEKSAKHYDNIIENGRAK